MARLLNKIRGRGPVQLAAGISRLVLREIGIRARQRQAMRCDYLHLDMLPPYEVDGHVELIEKWCDGAASRLVQYLSYRVTRLEADEVARRALLQAADDAVAGKLLVYGKMFDLDPMIDWNRDLTGSGTWPHRFVRRYRFPDTTGCRGDYRHVWELNRQQHLVLLGLAWRLTGDGRYVVAAIAHITTWLDQNPVYFTLNWASAMEVSLRLITWVVALSLVHDSDVVERRKLGKILRGMVQHARYLQDNLSVDLVQGEGSVKLRNNHTIVELCGLLTCIPFLETVTGEMSCRSVAELQSLLLGEIGTQTYPDGMNVEQSSSYQRFSLEAVLVAALGTDDMRFRASLAEVAREHLSALLALQITEDRFVLFGDEDNGHALTTRPAARPDDPSEARDLYAALGEVFPKAPNGVTVLPNSGHWCWRGDFGSVPVLIYFRAGRMDFPDIPGYAPHAQCDLLSFTLYVDGDPVCVDSGTYTYHEMRRRNALRSGCAHNRFGIAGYDQMCVRGVFGGDGFATAIISGSSAFEVTGDLQLSRNGKRIRLRRVLRVDSTKETLYLHDSVIQGPPGNVEWTLNLRGSVGGESADEQLYIGSGRRLVISGLPQPVLEDAEYSPAYGVLERSLRLVASLPRQDDEPVELGWSISVAPV